VPTLLPPFRVHQPSSLAEASALLVHYAEDARAYAGGTELLLAMKQGGLSYGHLVDLKTIDGLDAIRPCDGQLSIGALATHLAIERSPIVAAHLPILVALERHVANVRVRATGTLGGNLCFAEPHSDPATLLQCLDARLLLTGPNGERELSPADFLVGPYEVALEPGELLRAILVRPLRPSQRAAYQKFQVHEYPLLGLAVVLDLPDGQTITQARVAVGSVSPTPRRSPGAESLLTAARRQAALRLDDAADALADDAELLDDREGSAEYKRHLIHVLLRRAFEEAMGARD
jgi:aerobic carbon-monoxide dehydrogenase medium subunit